jgi:hypothetical protein
MNDKKTSLPDHWLGITAEPTEEIETEESCPKLPSFTGHSRQGQSRADGYYLHEPFESVGLYWVASGIGYLTTSRRFPRFLMKPGAGKVQAALVAALADNLRAAILARKRKLEAVIRQYETRTLIKNILVNKTPSAEADVADYITAESIYSSSLIAYPGDQRLAHEQRLSADDTEEFAAFVREAQPEAGRPFDLAYNQRIKIAKAYPKQTERAAKAAREFVNEHLKSDKFWFRDYPCIWQIRPHRQSRRDPNTILRGDRLYDLDPEWMTLFVEAMQASYCSDKCPWQKMIFRMHEPHIRLTEFERARRQDKRPTVGAAYDMWQETHGRYWGIEGTDHGTLLRSVRDLDTTTDELLSEMNIGNYQRIPKGRKGKIHERLDKFLNGSNEGYILLQRLSR